MAELAAWYQRKISAYDKQEWETTIERRRAIERPFKSIKLKSDLIDVDLIRGSSFPKAKPVQGLWTIGRLAVARIILFPLWRRWWAAHTSDLATRLFFLLWILQLLNLLLYFTAPNAVNLDSASILVPFSLSVGLGLVHAFMVSTNPHHTEAFRYLGHRDKTLPCILTKEIETPESSSDGSRPSGRFPRSLRRISSATQTDCKKCSLDGFRMPTVGATPPPAGQTVKFNLESPKDDDEPSVRRRQVNQRTSGTSAEDDGFESLNGNNSNGSENGYDRQNDTDPEAKLKRGDRLMPKKDYWDDDEDDDDPGNPSSDCNGKDTLRFEGPRGDGGSSTNLSCEHGHCESDDPLDSPNWYGDTSRNQKKPRKCERKEEIGSPSSDDECHAAPTRPTVDGISSEDPYGICSETDESEGLEGDSAWEPFAILNPTSERVTCNTWENNRVLKTQMTIVDISHAIAKRADQVLSREVTSVWPNTLVAGFLATLLPLARLLLLLTEIEGDQATLWNLPTLFLTNSPVKLLFSAFGATFWERLINVISTLLRFGLGTLVFFLLAVAQRAFNQRFLYAKLFSHLTSARRARQSSLPHFRLNRVRNIKAWLSVRSYLMRRGPQRSVDIIVSSAFVLFIMLISFLVVDFLQDQSQMDQLRTVEVVGWTGALGIVLLRLVALGTRASRKHRCLPVLLTEQINLHLAMERRPASKERLTVANNVLKLAADLLKELDAPFKISGLSTNPYLYTITKVVVLSALSGVLSDLLGFKLKLHKIKIK